MRQPHDIGLRQSCALIEKVFVLPDDKADFTRRMGFLVDRSSNGMSLRSWRYPMLVDGGVIPLINFAAAA